MAGVPELTVAMVRRYCDDKVPPQHRDQLRVECGVRGRSITIYDCQASWHPDLQPDWSRVPIAQLRYDPDGHRWRLFYSDRNSRWHPYDMVGPTRGLADLLAEIDADPTGIFWG